MKLRTEKQPPVQSSWDAILATIKDRHTQDELRKQETEENVTAALTEFSEIKALEKKRRNKRKIH